MGDRGNVVVGTEDGEVFLYSHWRGSDLVNIVKKSLKTDRARRRWRNAAYLARILFQDMVGDDDTEFGYGISPLPPYTGTEVYVDVTNQLITTLGFSSNDRTCTFEEFVEDAGFKSSAIQEISYSADGVLKVQFTSSDIRYSFSGVPASVHEAFVAAKSKGRFFAENIKGRYPSAETEYA